jgi:hypothetical protein
MCGAKSRERRLAAALAIGLACARPGLVLDSSYFLTVQPTRCLATTMSSSSSEESVVAVL